MRILVVLFVFALLLPGVSAPAARADDAVPSTKTALQPRQSRSVGPYRALVPGVEVTIPPDRQEEETVSTHDIIEITRGIPGLDWKPKYAPETQTLREMATQTVFRREIWCLEFTFKPVRMLWVDVPQIERQDAAQADLVHDLPRQKYRRDILKPVKAADGQLHASRLTDREVRGSFRSSCWKPRVPEGLSGPDHSGGHRRHPDKRKIPIAGCSTASKSASKPIPLSTELVDRSVWGVATWEDVDPRVDFFSVFVQG